MFTFASLVATRFDGLPWFLRLQLQTMMRQSGVVEAIDSVNVMVKVTSTSRQFWEDLRLLASSLFLLRLNVCLFVLLLHSTR